MVRNALKQKGTLLGWGGGDSHLLVVCSSDYLQKTRRLSVNGERYGTSWGYILSNSTFFVSSLT